MVRLELICPDRESEIVAAELWEHGAQGIEEISVPDGRCLLRAFFASSGDLLETFRAWLPEITEEQETDWQQQFQDSWKPFAVGQRFWLAPAWDQSETPVGRVRLPIHPGVAFGTGAHEATQLCLEALERCVPSGQCVLDIGTGTGILAEAAYLLGAAKVWACDIEHDSAACAHENLRRDAIPAGVFTGSTRAVTNGSIDWIVANVNATTHANLAAEYRRIARRGIVLSGIVAADVASLQKAFERPGWHFAETLTRAPWVALVIANSAH
jgi:ribosomal protein L11 methyltransferase